MNASRVQAVVRTYLDAGSIRGKLLLLVVSLLALGALNVAVIAWGSRERTRALTGLLEAIDRQRVIVEVRDRLADQKKFVDLLGSGVVDLGEAAAPSNDELRRFGRAVDSIPQQIGLLARTEDPELRDSVTRLAERAAELARAWQDFYANQGVDASAAIMASVRAEPIADELLRSGLPEAVAREEERVRSASVAFIEADRTVSRIAAIGFLASALVGGVLAFGTLRAVFASIRGLKRGADRVGAGDLDHRIPTRGHDELADVADSFNRMAESLRERTTEIERERRVSEDLLLNILPAHIADELRERGRVAAKYYPDTTIVFTDLVGFTRLFETMSVDRMVHLLDDLVTDFDRVVRSYQLEKLKTIGDAYMFAGGLARRGSSHPVDAVLAAVEMVRIVEERSASEEIPLDVRVGIHTGPVAAGVVGIDKFAFDVWGDTVNFASRLESSSEPGRINISHSAWLRVKDFFACSPRESVKTKEGRFDMYFMEGLHPEVAGPDVPPEPFAERYRIYFEQAPPAFPAILASEVALDGRLLGG